MSVTREEMDELLKHGTLNGQTTSPYQGCRECGLSSQPSCCANCGVEDSRESFMEDGECINCAAPLCSVCGLPKAAPGMSDNGKRTPRVLDPQDEARRHPENYLSGYCDDDGSRFLWDVEPGKVVIAWEDFKKLPQYSATNPTGVVAGKCWKRSVNGNGAAVAIPDPEAEWDLCWYGNRDTGFVWHTTGPNDPLEVKTRRIIVFGAPF